MTDYIRVRSWDRFQYRSDKPLPWIKNYDQLLFDDAYTSLNEGQRGILHGLWLLANRTQNKIPASPTYLLKQLSLGLADDDASGRGPVEVRSHAGRPADVLRRKVGRTLDRLRSLGFIETWEPSQNNDQPGAPQAHTTRPPLALDVDVDKEKIFSSRPKAESPNGTPTTSIVNSRIEAFVRTVAVNYPDERILREDLEDRFKQATTADVEQGIQLWRQLTSQPEDKAEAEAETTPGAAAS